MTKSVVSESKNVAKNIIIAVITSVIGATAIYLLGFNNKEPRLSDTEREEVTADAWKTYATIENIYLKNTESLLQDALHVGGYTDLLYETTKESEKLQNTLEDLIDRNGMNKDLVALFKKRLKEEKKEWPETEKFYKGLTGLAGLASKNHWTDQQSKDALKAQVILFAQYLEERYTRLAADIEDLSTKLSEKYGQPFNKDDFRVMHSLKNKTDIFSLDNSEKKDSVRAPGDERVNTGTDASNTGEPVTASKEYLFGKWDANSATITLQANGKFSWLIPSDNAEAKGTWQLKNNQVIMNIKKHPVTGKEATWTFDLSNVLTNSCTLVRTVTPFATYNLVRL
jgi:hypothetical protein